MSKTVQGYDGSGFMVLGTDYQSADIYERTPMLLKSQDTHKCCRVASGGLVVCDSMTCGGREGGGSGDGSEQQFELVRESMHACV